MPRQERDVFKSRNMLPLISPARWPALERLSPKKLKQVGLHRESGHRRNLVQVLVRGELVEHAVRQICPGGPHSAYVLFSHVIVSDGFCLKETRGPDDRPVKVTVHYQRFHSLLICIHRPPKRGDNERLEDFVKEEPSPRIVRIDSTRTDTDEATNASVVHGLHKMSRALRIEGNRFETIGDPESREDGILSGHRLFHV